MVCHRKWIENRFCNDGTEYIIYYAEGAYEVFEYYFSDDGELVFTGSYEQCRRFVESRWCAIAAACVG